MARLLRPIGIMILGLCAQGGVLGQDPGLRCPKLEVVGPSGVVLPGDQAAFSIYPEIPGLLYQWTVSAGVIESGERSSVIFVRTSEEDDGVELCASVTITGLTSDCRSTAEGLVLVQQGGHPPELDRYQGLPLPDELARLDSIIQKRREFASAGALYFFLSRSPNDSEAQLEHRKEAIRNRLMDGWGIPSSEIVFVFVDREFSTVFLIPFRKTGGRPPDAKDRTNATTECPTITVTGPAGIVPPGDSADFRAEISPWGSEPLTMVWTVSGGVIEKGQGESTLTVRTDKTMDGKLLYAHVEIFGFPAKCPNTARNSAAVSVTRHPIIIDEYGKLPENDEYARLDVTIHEISSNDGSVAVIVLNVGQEESEESVRSRVERIESHIFGLRKFERSKARFAFRRGLSSTTTIYRVPSSEADDIVNFYAESASPELLFSSPCPTFTVNGPAGIVQPGEPIIFTATIDGDLPKSARLVWSVNKGQIIEGWGTERIVIAADKNTLFSSTIMATLEIEGLSEGCQDSASETLPPIDFPEPILMDEFSDVPVTEIARERLAVAIREGVNNPTNQLYIIEYFPTWTSEFDIREKIARVRQYIADELKFDISYVTIVIAEGKTLNTRIYRVPPGAANPTP